jgi:hypothetical protein
LSILSGTSAACWGVYFYAGYPASLTCSAITTPGSLACTANTLYCYKNVCGFLNLEAFPLSLVKNVLPKSRS